MFCFFHMNYTISDDLRTTPLVFQDCITTIDTRYLP